MQRSIALLGVPSSAGASWPGIEKAPAAYRAAGIVQALTGAGCDVQDWGDLPVERWRSALSHDGDWQANNVERTVAVARQVKAAVREMVDVDVDVGVGAGRFALVLGGDCTITVGAYAGARGAGFDPRLVYVDEGADTYTPALTDFSHLDGMGVAHMLGLPHTTALRDLGSVVPMLDPEDVIFVGLVEPGEATGPHRVPPPGPRAVFLADDLRGRGGEAGREVLARLGADDRPFWLHFDVDVIDFFDLPVADVPVFRGGTPFADVAALIDVIARDARCLGMTVTEFNPDHADPDGREARVLVESLARPFRA